MGASPSVILVVKDALRGRFGMRPVDDEGVGVDDEAEACGVEGRRVHDLVAPIAPEPGVEPGCQQAAHNTPGLIPASAMTSGLWVHRLCYEHQHSRNEMS